MDIFTDVDKVGYLTNSLFFRPNPTGSERCIAVTREEGQRLTALYSVLVTLIISALWKYVNIIVMRYLDEPSNAEKYPRILYNIGLVGFWNSREPLEAVIFMLDYMGHLRPADKIRERWNIVGPAWGLLVLAVLGLALSYVSSIFVAATLIVGTMAPVNPEAVYVPKLAQIGAADLMRLQALRAPATLRALGSAEAASVTVRNRVTLDVSQRTGGETPYGFTYKYDVTAYDMGLQHWHGLKQEVTGRCNTDDGWYTTYDHEQDVDVYRPWGVDNTTYRVVRDGERKTAPHAQAFAFPYDPRSDDRTQQPAENRYGIIVHSSHRASHRPSTDPWYATEPFTPPENDTEAQDSDPPGNRVRGGRPALSCTQTDVWSYNGRKFKNIYEMSDNDIINFPDGWFTQMQLDFANPRIIDMINSAGPSSLVSSMTFVGGRFDAETSTIEKDISRLLVATWIASSHTFRNMLMVDDRQNIPNAALKGTEDPQSGVGLFVVSTPQVATLRLSVLVAVPTVLVVLIFGLWVLGKAAKPTDWHQRMVRFEAAYLYGLPELGNDGSGDEPKDWGSIVKKCVEKE